MLFKILLNILSLLFFLYLMIMYEIISRADVFLGQLFLANITFAIMIVLTVLVVRRKDDGNK